MRHLLLLRHAKSSWGDAGLADHERPLNERGKRDGPRMGRLVAELGVVPGLIVSSSAVRALATARLVAEAAGVESGAIRVDEGLYHAESERLMGAVRCAPDSVERLMVVGHNPGMEELVGRLAGRATRFPTGALAHVVFAVGRWCEVSASGPIRLIEVYRPKEL